MRLQLLHSDRNAPLLGIDFENLDLDRLVRCEHVGWLVDPAPGDVADMKQRVHSTYIHEGAIVSQASHRAAYRIAFFHLGVPPALDRLLFLFGHGTTIYYNVFFRRIALVAPAPAFPFYQFLHLAPIPLPPPSRSHHR